MFNALDTPPTVSRTLLQTKKFLEEGDDDESGEEDESESSDEEEFEDVPLNSNGKGVKRDEKNGESEESEDEAWEDALGAVHHTK